MVRQRGEGSQFRYKCPLTKAERQEKTKRIWEPVNSKGTIKDRQS